MADYSLVRMKRLWIPDCVFGLFCHDGLFSNWATKQPFRWILTQEPDELTLRRSQGKRKR